MPMHHVMQVQARSHGDFEVGQPVAPIGFPTLIQHVQKRRTLIIVQGNGAASYEKIEKHMQVGKPVGTWLGEH